MALILCIESTSKNCSVAVVKDGHVLAIKERVSENYTHAEELHPFIQEVIHNAGLAPKDLQAVMVSAGPGSYTGLRIGVAAAKGICFSLSIPLLAADTLSIMAKWAIAHLKGFDVYQPMIDARRMEVYTGVWDVMGNVQSTIDAVVLDEAYFAAMDKNHVLFGDGAAKCQGLTSAHVMTDVWPSADKMAPLAEELFVAGKAQDLAYFEPFYLKDFQPGKPKKDPLVK